jgi:hypothetical protein
MNILKNDLENHLKQRIDRKWAGLMRLWDISFYFLLFFSSPW